MTMLARPEIGVLHALIRLRIAAPGDFEVLVRYLNEAEQMMLAQMRDSNDPSSTRLMQGASRALFELRDRFTNAHRQLAKRQDSGRESDQLPPFVQSVRSP